jgi:hypothetical protein
MGSGCNIGPFSSLIYGEKSLVQKSQRWSGAKLNSRATNTGANDWNPTGVVAYVAQFGVLGPFGSPFFANWVQYRIIIRDNFRWLARSC